ncbi:MAG: hypothetical protein PVI23_14980 [Maricaulaceae bacterium]|jgi:hypothetical protein
MVRSVLFSGVAALTALSPVNAIFVISEVEEVPVERLIANLEAEAEATDDNADQTRIFRRLARLHALAYARGAETLPVDVESGQVRESDEPRGFLQTLDDRGQHNEAAEAHLDAALDLYEMLAAFDQYDVVTRLGYAWALEQAARSDEAATHYAAVADAAWALEREQTTGLYYGEMSIFQEAATALVQRYLDPEEDAARIAELNERLATSNRVPRWITPILAPLEADLPFNALVDPDAAVAFDLDGSGLDRQWGWITPDAAWLVWDPAGEARIESGLQMFGSISFFAFWDDGYQALSALDDNHDEVLSGIELEGLAFWTDADSNGVSDPGEVRPVTEHGVAAIATRSVPYTEGFPYQPVGLTMTDGTTRATYDWIMRAEPGPAALAAR